MIKESGGETSIAFRRKHDTGDFDDFKIGVRNFFDNYKNLIILERYGTFTAITLRRYGALTKVQIAPKAREAGVPIEIFPGSGKIRK